MKIKKEVAREMAWSSVGDDWKEEGVEKVVENELIDTSRWSNIHRLTLQVGGKFYQADYSVGATEGQDESPFEDDGDEVEFKEVFAREKTITVYE